MEVVDVIFGYYFIFFYILSFCEVNWYWTLTDIEILYLNTFNIEFEIGFKY